MQTWCLLADTHSGSPVGLTPEPNNKIQEQLLDRYLDSIEWFDERPDIVLHVGDLVQGIHPKLQADDPKLVSQYDKASETLVMWKPKREYILIRGTMFHTAVDNQEFEELAAKQVRQRHWELYQEDVKVSICSRLETYINDWFLLDARHKIGRSVVPYGRNTAPLRNQTWGILNAALKSKRGNRPADWPDLKVFAHNHYYTYAENAWGATMVLPSWQATGDKYGEEQCDGHIDLGVVKLCVGDSEDEGWTKFVRLYGASVVSRTGSR